jgi:hypothetical protein
VGFWLLVISAFTALPREINNGSFEMENAVKSRMLLNLACLRVIVAKEFGILRFSQNAYLGSFRRRHYR